MDFTDSIKNVNDALTAVLRLLPEPAPAPALAPAREPVPVVTEPPDPDAERRGLDLLFDKPVMYRHKCMACGHVRINQLTTAQKCNRCGKPMTSVKVTPHTGKKYRRHNKTPAAPAPATGTTRTGAVPA